MRPALFRFTRSLTRCALFFLPFATAFAAAETAPEPVVVGQFASLTGKEASFGQSSHRGVVLAVDDGVPCSDDDCDVPLCCGPGARDSSATDLATTRSQA